MQQIPENGLLAGAAIPNAVTLADDYGRKLMPKRTTDTSWRNTVL